MWRYDSKKCSKKFWSILGFCFEPKIPKISVAIGCLGIKTYGSQMSSFLHKKTVKETSFSEFSVRLNSLLNEDFSSMVFVGFLFFAPQRSAYFWYWNVEKTSAPLEREGIRLVFLSFYPVPKRWLKIILKKHANKKYFMRVSAIWIHEAHPVNMTPAVSCHFFSSIKHLIPKVSEALQNSWVALCFFHVFFCYMRSIRQKEGGRPAAFLGSHFLPPLCFPFLSWITVPSCIFVRSNDCAFRCDGSSWLRPSRDPPSLPKTNSPIFWVKFHYMSRTSSLPLTYQPVPHLTCSYLFLTRDPSDTGLWSIDS